jgi:hypothetical protein
VPRHRQQDFWPPLYGWGSSLGEDHAPTSSVLYRRRTRGRVAWWWDETRSEWALWWTFVTGR